MVFLAAVLVLAGLPAVQEGDLIFHTSRSGQSLAVQRATRSRYSHMGIVLFRSGQPYVFEAVGTVRYTPLADWVARGERGRFVVKRLKEARTLLPKEALERLRRAAGSYAGKRYDLTFEWSDDRIYCSELVWKMYRDALDLPIGERQKLREFDLDDPVVKKKLRERYGAKVPLDEPAISPQAMFDAAVLETVSDR
jgi:hypothetical protein